MPNHLKHALAAAITGLASLGSAAAADVSGRTDRPLVLQERTEVEVERYDVLRRAPRPIGRPLTGGPGYVGSDYGLGKPAFTGLGSRPDWGYSE